jgi:hypothetical protein
MTFHGNSFICEIIVKLVKGTCANNDEDHFILNKRTVPAFSIGLRGRLPEGALFFETNFWVVRI